MESLRKYRGFLGIGFLGFTPGIGKIHEQNLGEYRGFFGIRFLGFTPGMGKYTRKTLGNTEFSLVYGF